MLPDRKTSTRPGTSMASEQVREIQPLHKDHLLISSTLTNSCLPAVINLIADKLLPASSNQLDGTDEGRIASSWILHLQCDLRFNPVPAPVPLVKTKKALGT